MATITSPTAGSHFNGGVTAGDTLTLSKGSVSAEPVAYAARWQWNLANAESGSNVGSDLQLQSIADDGTTIIATPMSINRATGAITYASGSTVSAPYFLRSVGAALTAVGTTRANALQLAKEINQISTAAASTGVVLPVGQIGMVITIFNAGANAIKVYASGSETIDTVAGATGVTLTNALRCNYYFVAANTWISAQLGVISA